MSRIIAILSIFLFCLPSGLLAQVQGWQWTKKSSSNDRLIFSYGIIDLTTDSKENVYSTAFIGNSDSNANFNIDGHNLKTFGGTDILLTSFSCDGNYRWSKVIGCRNDSDRIVAVRTDSLGNVYACGTLSLKSYSGGSTNGFIDTDTTLIGNSYRTIFVAKWDSTGHFKWLRMPQPDTISYLNAIKNNSLIGMDVSPNGTIHLACYLSPGGYAGYRTWVNTTGVYVLRYDGDGNYTSKVPIDMHDAGNALTWVKYFFTQFKYDPVLNKYLIYGTNSSTYNTDKYIGNSAIHGGHAFLASFNASNGSLAYRKISTSRPNHADSVVLIDELALDHSGNIYISGEAEAGSIFNGLPFNNALSRPNSFIMKINGINGDTLWSQKAQRTQSMVFRPFIFYFAPSSIAVSNGVVCVGGRLIDSLIFPGHLIHNNRLTDSFDLFMMRLNASTGNINSTEVIPSGLANNVDHIGTDNRGNFYLTGFSADSILFSNPNSPGSLNLYDPNTNLYPIPFLYLAKWGVASCTCTPPSAGYIAGAGSGKTMILSYTGTTLGVDSLVWDWGDKQSTTITSSFSTPVSHTYASLGQKYLVCVNVYSTCGSKQFCGLTNPVGITQIHSQNDLPIYPNPTKDFLQLEGQGNRPYKILNPIGQVITEGKVPSSGRLDIKELAAGTYLLSIQPVESAPVLSRFSKL